MYVFTCVCKQWYVQNNTKLKLHKPQRMSRRIYRILTL